MDYANKIDVQSAGPGVSTRNSYQAPLDERAPMVAFFASFGLFLTFAGTAIGQSVDPSGTGAAPKSFLEIVKTLAEISQALVTTIGIVVGSWWTYQRFVKQRTEEAKAKIRIGGSGIRMDDDRYLLDIEFEITNIGAVQIPILLAKLIVKQVLPAPDDTLPSYGGQTVGHEVSFPWPEIDRRHWEWEKGLAVIEPGDSQRLTWAFSIAKEVERIELFAYFENSSVSAARGWTARSVLDLNKEDLIVKTKTLTAATESPEQGGEKDGPMAPQVPDPDKGG